MTGKILLLASATLIGIFLVFPEVVILAESITVSNTEIPVLSAENYVRFFSSRPWLESLATSVLIAVIGSLLCSILSVSIITGLKLSSNSDRAARFALAGLMLPFYIPAVALGISWARILHVLGISGQVGVLIILEASMALPLAVTTTMAAARNIDKSMLESVLANGVSRRYLIQKVFVPSIARGATVGLILSFLAIFDEVVVAQFVSDPNTYPLSLRVWAGLRYYTDPNVFVIGTLTMVLGLILISLAARRANW